MKRNSDDIKIAELLKKEVPNCPENEWFVKKVLNRLPEKRPSFFSRAEIFSFVAAGLVLLVCWILHFLSFTTSEAITLGDLVYPTILSVLTLTLICYITYQYCYHHGRTLVTHKGKKMQRYFAIIS